MSTSCPSPLSLDRQRAFDQANALVNMANSLYLHGHTFEAALHLLQASTCGISAEAKQALRERAKELTDALHAKAWGAHGAGRIH